MSATPAFFKSGKEFRRWLSKNHDSVSELVLGFYKKDAGVAGISYQEAVDEALCYGWIDGVRKRYDDRSYTGRFTPRRARSIWSAVNTRRAGELVELGRMAEPGLRAFKQRDPALTNRYSFEQRSAGLDAPYERTFKKDTAAWKFFAAQPPGYRRMASWYVMSAKKDETRQRRLERLMEISREGRRLEPMTPSKP